MLLMNTIVTKAKIQNNQNIDISTTENPNDVNTITDGKGFPRDMNDISKDHDDNFNLFYE